MSKVLPAAIQDRPDLNHRQGIKSSLSNWRQLLASLYLFHRYGGSSFCKEIPTGAKTLLDVDDRFAMWLNTNLNSVFNIVPLVKQSALYSAQMEHLQVGLELFLKLAKVNFVDSSLADSAERTGGSRFAKRIRFSTNMKLFVDTINSYSDSDRTNFLSKWLSGADDAIVSKRVKEVLTPFTEECQYKIRTASGEISFQEDGVYSGLRNVGDTVESSDTHEPVGPFRILKSYVKEGMHPYLSDSSNGFAVKVQQTEFTDYADMVRTTLELIPKRTVVFQEVAPIVTRQSRAFSNEPRQLVVYGAPGTGKSHRTKLETEGHAVYRTTFHPDSDYSTFVGAYKPAMKPEQRINCIDDKAKTVKDADGKPSMQDVISYDFVPQAFIKAYVDAWQKWAGGQVEKEGGGGEGKAEPVFLVIEEINRGNCAQIFGDLFQLLDRDEDGYSEYAIDADADLARWLAGQFSGGQGLTALPADVASGKKLVLPPNLYIRATMNTSDQSLFPIDSAFKRRWEWKYVPIAKPTEAGWQDRVIVCKWKEKNSNGQDVDVAKAYDWWEFLKIANAQILETTKSEDKQLGYFFVKAPDATGHIKADRFTGKVLFYLYNDVFKDYSLPAALFGDGSDGSTKYEFKMFFDEHGETKEDVVAAFLDQLKIPSEILASADATERVPPNGD